MDMNEYRVQLLLNKAKNENKNNNITIDTVVNGLKFLAENQELEYYEMAKNLINLGCAFDKSDIEKVINNNTPPSLRAGIKCADFATGVLLLAGVLEDEHSYNNVKKCYLKKDNQYSIYHYIRTTTKDKSYTLDNILQNKSNVNEDTTVL